MLIVRHLGTPNSDFNGCHCMRDPVSYRSMVWTQGQLSASQHRVRLFLRVHRQTLSVAYAHFSSQGTQVYYAPTTIRSTLDCDRCFSG